MERELKILEELALIKKAKEKGVTVNIEGIGYMELDYIITGLKIELEEFKAHLNKIGITDAESNQNYSEIKHLYDELVKMQKTVQDKLR